MRHAFIILLTTLLCYMGNAFAADDVMPIIAYMGVPDWKTSDENFKTLSECGFNVSLYPYSNVDVLVKACRTANKYGVRVLGYTEAMSKSPAQTAKQLKDEPGFYGYFLKDEPNAKEFKSLQTTISKLKAVDTKHCFYINLLPYYNPDWVPDMTKVNTYEEYLNASDDLACQQISFDYYPITKEEGIRNLWYYNLELIRQHSLATNRPFWGFVLSVPHYVYPAPTMGSLRLQIYSNLAYGAQAIEYFTYWTPGKDEGYDYHDGPVDHNGKKTATYTLVQKMNKELRSIAPLFYGAKITAINHIGKVPKGTKKLKSTPANIKKIITKGNNGALISQFTKGNHQYLAIVNKDYKDSLSLHIEKKNNIPLKVNTDLSLQTMVSDYKVPAGGMAIFRLK